MHMDDLYAGWSGIDHAVTDQLDAILRPLAEGRAGSYRRFDWVADGFAETHVVEPGPLLVLEGVGSGTRAHADLCTTLVWVDAPHDLRMTRGLERDGENLPWPLGGLGDLRAGRSSNASRPGPGPTCGWTAPASLSRRS